MFGSFLIILIGLAFIQTLRAEDISSRIYEGKAAARGEFPYIARTLIAHAFSNITHVYTFCGASLINDRWLVSAAHCSVGAVQVKVTLGMLNISDYSGTLSYDVPKSGIFVHPKYVPNTHPSADIVLYKLPSSVPFDKYSYIKPIQPPNLGANSVSQFDGSLATTSGWGATENGTESQNLLYTIIKVMNNSECIQKISPGATNATICTERHYKNAGPCLGDSGGPLVVNGTTGPELVGITSFGAGNPPCSDPNGATVFTYVPFYKDWIQKTISSN